MNLLEACNIRAGDKERYRMRTIIIEKGVERVVVSFFLRIESTNRVGIVNKALCERARFYGFFFLSRQQLGIMRSETPLFVTLKTSEN